MIVMITNNTGFDAGRLFGAYPNRLAHLHNSDPGGAPKEPKIGIPWALDNGVFGAWQRGEEWTEEPFYSYLDKYSHHRPWWILVPDAVADREKTLEMWSRHWPAVAAYNAPLAFAAQDGMTPDDVPKNAEVVFVGGSTSWKWRNLRIWTEAFPRVHVGRVNSRRMLEMAEDAGAESCDGTGWFRDPTRTSELESYLQNGICRKQLQFA